MTQSQMIPNPPRVESDSASRQAEFEALSKELAEEELELATLTNELAVFETRYTHTIGILFAELDELEKEIAWEVWRLHPGERYQKIYQEAQRKAKSSQDAVGRQPNQRETKKFVPSEALKNLYRRIAKAIHPDLAIDEDEKVYRTELMARANDAYSHGDQAALTQIMADWENKDRNLRLQDAQSTELTLLEEKILRVRLRLKEIGAKIANLRNSELYQLMLKVEQAEQRGRDLLSEMANDIRRQIQAAQARLAAMKQQKQQVLYGR